MKRTRSAASNREMRLKEKLGNTNLKRDALQWPSYDCAAANSRFPLSFVSHFFVFVDFATWMTVSSRLSQSCFPTSGLSCFDEPVLFPSNQSYLGRPCSRFDLPRWTTRQPAESQLPSCFDGQSYSQHVHMFSCDLLVNVPQI